LEQRTRIPRLARDRFRADPHGGQPHEESTGGCSREIQCAGDYSWRDAAVKGSGLAPKNALRRAGPPRGSGQAEGRAHHARGIRSPGWIGGRRVDRRYRLNWCRSAPISSRRMIRERNVPTRKPSRARKMGAGIMTWRSFGRRGSLQGGQVAADCVQGQPGNERRIPRNHRAPAWLTAS
jgi:hypothetical protein